MSESSNKEDTLDATWERVKRMTDRVDKQFHVTQKVEVGRQYAIDHPIVTMFAVITLVFCTIPLLGFICFVAGTLLFTFVGFLFIEGFLLTVGTLFLGGILCAVGFLSLGVSTFFALAWLSARYGHKLITEIRSKIPTPNNMPVWSLFNRKHAPVRVDALNGECVKDVGREKDM